MQNFLPYFLVPYSQNHLYVTSFLLPLSMPYCPVQYTRGLFFTIANQIWWAPDFPAHAVHYNQGFTMSRFTIAGGNCTRTGAAKDRPSGLAGSG